MELSAARTRCWCSRTPTSTWRSTSRSRACTTTREACTSTARILVADAIHDEFCDRFARATERLVVGDPLHPNTDIGPMVDLRQRDGVLEYLRIGLDEGARLVTQVPSPTTSA